MSLTIDASVFVSGVARGQETALHHPDLNVKDREKQMNSQIEQSIRALQPKIDQLCKDNAVQRMALFGSALRPDYPSASDLDILIEFEPGCTPGLDFFRIQQELTDLVGRRVDLNTSAMLSKAFREKVVTASVDIYVH